MEEFPGNSNKQKPKDDEIEPKKVEKVIQGEAIRRKKPLGKKFSETFVRGDARSAWQYVAFDVLIPAAKDMVADAMSQGVEKLLFGDARSTSRRGGRPGGPNGHVSYNRYAPSSNLGKQYEPRNVSHRARANHDFDEIILASRVEAEAVIDRLFDLVSRYEAASVSDLYEMVGIAGTYVDDKWGWTDLRGSGVTRIRNGYLLNLPRPVELD